MALSHLQIALATLDEKIAEVSAKMDGPSSYAVPGLQVAKARLKELLEARKGLLEAIAQEERHQDGGLGIVYAEFEEPEER